MSHGYAPLKCLQLNKGLSKNPWATPKFTIQSKSMQDPSIAGYFLLCKLEVSFNIQTVD